MRTPNKTKAVELAVDAFMAQGGISLGETPAIAKNRCYDLSMAFSWYCRGLGEFAVMLHVVGAKKKISMHVERAGDEKIVAHWLVYFPDEEKAVDWTARQFWPEAPHPWIISKAGLAAIWNEIEWPPEEYKQTEGVTVQEALEESVKHQSHYAKLLNQYDQGKRMTFKNGAAWIARLNECRRIAKSND